MPIYSSNTDAKAFGNFVSSIVTSARSIALLHSPSSSGVQTFSLTVASSGQTTNATTTLTVNTLPPLSVTSSGNVRITITAPVGYTLSFPPSLTSIQVSGGSLTPINNAQWTVSTNLANQQLTLTMASGAFIGAGGESSLGFSMTRTSANSGSVSNITVNVADDLTMTYDGNLANNVYARIISGL